MDPQGWAVHPWQSPLDLPMEIILFSGNEIKSQNREVLLSDRTENGTKVFQEIFQDVHWYTQQYYLLFSTVGAIYYSVG